jgi:hypothetical protein
MKNNLYICFSICVYLITFSAHSQTPNNVPSNGLIGYWPFTGNANNSGVNNLNGVINGAILTNDRNANANSAYLFSSSSNSISIQNNSLLSLNNTDFTINAWIKLDNFPSLGSSNEQYNQYYTILGKRQAGASESNYSIGISTPNSPNGAGNLVFAQGPAGVGSFVSSNNPINTGAWHNICFVYTLNNQTIKLYVNNILVSQQTGVTIPGENSANFWFGNDVSGSATYFPGAIDDIGIWNRALSLNELSSLYSPCNGTIAPPTITVSGPTTICQGESVVLLSSNSTGNVWSTGATSQSITVTAGGSYSVSVDTLNCISFSDPVIVSVSQVPDSIEALSSGSTIFCVGDSVTLSLNSLSAVRYLKFESFFSSDNGQVNVYEIQAISNGVNVALNKPGFANSYEYGDWTTNGSKAVDGNNGSRWSSDRNDPGPDTLNSHYIVIDLGTPYNLESILLNLSNHEQTFSLKVSQDNMNWIEVGSGESVSGSVNFTPPATNFSSYLWSNGAITPSIMVGESGSYSLTAYIGSTCSVSSNTINVVVNPLPVTPTISVSGPTTICQGETVVLTSSYPADNTWSNGETTQSIVVSQSGTYTVSVANDNCTSISEPVTVSVSQLPNSIEVVSSGSTTICEGDSVTLSLNILSSPFSSYLWSNGETTPSITVTESGNYSLTSYIGSTCAITSNLQNIVVNPIPVTPTTVASGPTTICQGETVVLTSSSDSSNVWSNGETTQSITVTQSGFYSVVNGGCSSPSQPIEIIVSPQSTSLIAPGNITINTSPNQCFVNNVDLGNPIGESCTNFSITNNAPNEFPIGLTVVTWTLLNENGTSITANQDVMVEFSYESASLCYVTSDINQPERNRIFINNANNENVLEYQILREVSLNQYSVIGTIPPNQNSFLDLTSNNLSLSRKYRVNTLSICNSNSIDINTHGTILLQNNLAVNGSVNLNWNPYLGISYDFYNIYRKTGNGSFELIETFPSSNLSYNDVTANVSTNSYQYYIEIEVPNCDSIKTNNAVRSNIIYFNDGELGMMDHNLVNEVIVAPNPSTGVFNLILPNSKEIRSLIVHDINGKEFFVESCTEIDLSDLSDGIYMLNIIFNDGKQIQKKLVKNI